MVKLRPRRTSQRLQVSRLVPKVRDVVEVLWEDRGLAFRGRLAKRLRAKNNVFLVSYDDGDEAWHDLDEHYWRLAGARDWVPPTVFEVESPSRNVGEARTWTTKLKRRQPSPERFIQKRRKRKSTPTLEGAALQHYSQPPKESPRKLSMASLSHTNDEKLPVKGLVDNDSVSPKSEVSTQLSSCKDSAREVTRYNKAIQIVTADAHFEPCALNSDDSVQAKQSHITTATTNSDDSNDQRFPPRKRKSFVTP